MESIQWFKNGDHPLDGCVEYETYNQGNGCTDQAPYWELTEGKVVKYFRFPEIHEQDICPDCNKRYKEHGWLEFLPNGQKVCPGDWIITLGDGRYYAVKKDIPKLMKNDGIKHG